VRAYPREPTVDAGGTLVLHVSTRAPRYRVRLERWSDRCEIVLEAGPFAGEDAPPGAAGSPWDWPRIAIPLPATFAPGAYVARCIPEGGAFAQRGDTPDARWGTALFVVRAPSAARVLMNLPLFTYHAYNVAHADGSGQVAPGGHAAMVTFRRGSGTVFNAGTVDWARALGIDAAVAAITRSIVQRLSED
jgi:hypothetical protein